MVNDLRDDYYKTGDDIYLIKHEDQELRVIKMTVDASASKFNQSCLINDF